MTDEPRRRTLDQGLVIASSRRSAGSNFLKKV